MLEKDLILLGLDCKTSEEVLKSLGEIFVKTGAVKQSFVQAVIDREKVYPTGLPAQAFDIAIPHTVSEHVIRPAIAVAVLKEPVAFLQMGSPEITLHPRIVMMLAIKDPKEQLTLLKKMMKLLKNSEILSAVVQAADAQTVLDLLSPELL